MQPQTAHRDDALSAQGLAPHLAGAGPSFFLLLDATTDVAAVERACDDLGFEAQASFARCRAPTRAPHRADLMAEVFSGFVVGYAMALLVAPLGAIMLVRSNQHTGFAQRIAPPGTNVVALSMVLHFAAMLVLTALGMRARAWRSPA